jgi:pentatricopeptide repeat protein
MGIKDAAIFYEKMGVNILQTTRARITSLEDSLQKSFLQSKEGYYYNLIDLLTEQGRITEAEQVLSMMKEEEFFDFIGVCVATEPKL